MSKSLLNKISHWTKQFVEDPEYKIAQFVLRFIDSDRLPDRLFIKYQFHYAFGYPLNLKHPRTFNEKLNWMKLYDRNPLYTTLVDKYAVKKWVANRIGDRYIIPTIKVYNRVDEIDLDELPNQFVLKCTHDSGSVVVCQDKENFDFDSAKMVLQKGLNTNFYLKHREWPYKNVPHRIIAEEYMEDIGNSSLPDYKFFCFDGEPKFMFVATERSNPNEETKFDFFDMEYHHLSCTNGHPNARVMPVKPKHFEEMKRLARELSAGLKHVRVDLYEVGETVYFGEMTMFHWGGEMKFNPEDFDVSFGEYLRVSRRMHSSRGGGLLIISFSASMEY